MVGNPNLAVETKEGDNIKLRICPTCHATYSKFDSFCERCTKIANLIEKKLPDINKHLESGEDLTPQEHSLLDKINNYLALVELDKENFLKQSPFKLSEDVVVVSPSYKNRLLFFMDRMRAAGRNVTTTQAATKLFKEFGEEKKPISKKEFINFAINHGVRPLMTADWEQLFAAWDVKDILKLKKEYDAEQTTTKNIELKPEGKLSSLEAASSINFPGIKSFVDFAISHGVEPSQSFGSSPEQMIWDKEDVELLGKIWKLEQEVRTLEESEQKISSVIERLEGSTMKYDQMLVFQQKKKDLLELQNLIKEKRDQIDQESDKVKEIIANKKKAPKEASDRRLAKILAIAAGPEVVDKKKIIDKIYDIQDNAIRQIIDDKEIFDLLSPEIQSDVKEGSYSFDDIMGILLDQLQFAVPNRPEKN